MTARQTWKRSPLVADFGDLSGVDHTTEADMAVPRWDGPAAQIVFERTQRISVLHPRFGANTGNGGAHDDTPAWQAAVDYCIANNCVLEIPKPPVAYQLYSTLVMQPVAGTNFHLDIDARTLGTTDVVWNGPDNTPVIQTFGRRFSYWAGLQIRLKTGATGVVGVDENTDATRGFAGPNLHDNVNITTSGACTDCVGWRFGHGSGGSNGSGMDGERFRGCHVIFGAKGTGCVGWVNEQANGLGHVFHGGGAVNANTGYSNQSTPGAVQATGGNCLFFDNVECTGNDLDFDLNTAGGYAWHGGRFEDGKCFLKTGISSAHYVLPIDGITLARYNPADGKVIDVRSPAALALRGVNMTRASSANGTGDISNNSNQVTNATGNWAQNDTISGAGIPANTKVLSVAGTTLTLSANATATTAGLALSTNTFGAGAGLSAGPIAVTNSTSADSSVTLEDSAFTSRDPVAAIGSGKWRLRVQNCTAVNIAGQPTARMRQRGPGVNALHLRRPRIITPQLHAIGMDNGVAVTSQRAYGNRLVVSELCDTFDFSMYVSAVAAADDPIDLGIYKVNALGQLSRLWSTGPTTGTGLITGTLGVKTFAPGTSLTLSPDEVYYVLFVVALTGAAPTMRGPNIGSRADYSDLAGTVMGAKEWGSKDIGTGTLPVAIDALANASPLWLGVGVA